MEVKLPRDYYRKYDFLCFKLASHFVDYPAVKDKKFIQWVQDNRVARIEQGTEKYGAITRYSEPYMFGIALRKCKQKLQQFDNTAVTGLDDNCLELLFDSLNYIMIEYLTRLYTYKPLDEIDVLSIFYTVTISETETVYDAAMEMLDVYYEFYEYGYLMLTSLVIYAELYKVWKGNGC